MTRTRRPAGAGSAPPSVAAVRLALTIAILGSTAAAIGLFGSGAPEVRPFTSVQGETVLLYGSGPYRFDSIFHAGGNRGTDLVTLLLGVPLLLIGTMLYRRGSLRGGLVLTGALTWFVYVYGSYALGAVAYNELFLVYVATFGASLFALLLTYRTSPLSSRSFPLPSRLPKRGLAMFMFVSAFATLGIWLVSPVRASLRGVPPAELESYTTLFTTALDIAIIVPAAIVAGLLIRRREPEGYAVAFPLLVLEAFLAPLITAQTVFQLRAGVEFTPGQIAGPILGFVVLGAAASWFIRAVLQAFGPDRRRAAGIIVPPQKPDTQVGFARQARTLTHQERP